MQVMRCFRNAAAAATLVGCLFATPPAVAGLPYGPTGFAFEDGYMLLDAASTAQHPGSAPMPAGVVALRAAPAQESPCDGCDFEQGVAATPDQNGPTLQVNMAILVLGSLWVALMARRIQQRTAAEDRDDATLEDALEQALERALRGGGPQHAAGGR
jgi:hypothetical protein